MKEFRQPDRTHDDSFDLEDIEAAEERGRRSKHRPGKKSKAESLDEVLELIRDPALPEKKRERIASRYLMERRESGRGLEGSLASDFGKRLGTDLSAVRVHTDPEAAVIARALGATALTFGKDIFFAAGVYQPHSPRGRHVIAHEVAHVAQHRGQAPSAVGSLEVGRVGDRHEREADVAASRILRGKSARVSRASAGVRFMKQAFGELDEPIVADGAAGLGCSPEELAEIQRLVDSGKAFELLDGAQSRKQKNIIFFCIGRSDIAQDDTTKAFLREHDNPKPEEKIEVHGVNAAQRATEQAQAASRSENAVISQQPDEAPKVQTTSARSSETSAPGGIEAQNENGRATAEGIKELSGSEQQLIQRELNSHEIWLAVSQGLQQGGMEFVSDPANMMDVGITASVAMLKRVGRFSTVAQAMSGARALYSLINRDWEQTWERLSSWGEGATEYERLANNIGVITESIDLMLSVMRSIAGGLGLASAGLWLSSVMTLGVTAPVAATLSAIAIGVSTAAGVLSMIRNAILVPAEASFRGLDRYQKMADPSAPEQAGGVLVEGAEGILALLGGMASTPDGGGPSDASGSARAGNTSQAALATPSPADLPLQDVSPQGFESVQGAAADVESDAAGTAVRDQNRDPDRAAPGGRQLAATEAADDMTGRGKPAATPGQDQVEGRNAEAGTQVAAAASVGDTNQSEFRGGGGGEASAHASANTAEVPLELDPGGAEVQLTTTRPDAAEAQGGAMHRLADYQAGPDSEPAGQQVEATGGRDNPPTTLGFLNRLKQTIAFLTETRRRASGTKTADIKSDSGDLLAKGRELQKDVASRKDAHRGQKQRVATVEKSARQFKSEESRANTALATINKISDVTQMLGQLPGRLGTSIGGLATKISRAASTWTFVSDQMTGQEQEVTMMHARQTTEENRLNAVSDRANTAVDKLSQADSAIKSASTTEQSGSAPEMSAIDRQLDKYRATYNRLSGSLMAWAQTNSSNQTA